MEPSPDTNDIVADGGSDDNGRTEKESVSSGSTNSIGYDDFFFGKFCRHIPRILRHQLISKLVNQYVYKMKEADDMPDSAPNRVVSKAGDAGVDFKANTSIYRFHGALLFVDISGFTVLSQKLKVDDLKNHINAYFQKIVDIIDKYDGEIIKFAGDALFIVWQTKVSDIGNFHNFMVPVIIHPILFTSPYFCTHLQLTRTFYKLPRMLRTKQSPVVKKSILNVAII